MATNLRLSVMAGLFQCLGHNYTGRCFAKKKQKSFNSFKRVLVLRVERINMLD